MNLIGPFFKLIRWPNLVFIVITQLLFNYGVVHPLFRQAGLTPNLNHLHFSLLCIASVLIAAAGYIINDYFDVNIDRINKPDRVLIDRVIHRRWAIFWHMFLSMTGVVLSFIVSFSLSDGYFVIGFINFLCVIILWLYSTTYKRKILVGNILISLLTAWTVLVIYAAEIPHLWDAAAGSQLRYQAALTKLLRVAALYGGFAFVISLVREVVKDLEDMEGDRKEGCRTMPIVWGVPASKIFAAVWLVVLIGILIITQVYVVQFGWWISALYIITTVVLPLIYIMKWLYKANQVGDYSKLSRWIKIVMLTGILSMLFFRFYF
ncbi:MAG: geranylgeranylglycerol-phosphate geranylgeranyltransferase [Chitinophagaceae bacterium]